MIVSNETKIAKKYPKKARTFHFISNEKTGKCFFSSRQNTHTSQWYNYNGIVLWTKFKESNE